MWWLISKTILKHIASTVTSRQTKLRHNNRVQEKQICFIDTNLCSKKLRKTVVWLTVFCRPNLFSLCNLQWESHSPLPWLTAVVAKQGSSGSETLCERLGIPLSGNWQWDNSWKDVFFTTPSVCQVWGGKVGYDEVEGETWVNCNFYFSLFEGQRCQSFGGLRSVSYLWPRLWHEGRRANRPVGGQRKSHFCGA